MTPPMHSSGSPLNVFASILRCGSSCSMPPPSPRSATNSAPLLLRETAPAVLMSPCATFASPVAGSNWMTSPASLFANSTVPFSPAIGPSTLLPCHDQTTFQLDNASSTPGIDVVGGSTGSGGAAVAAAALPAPGIANGCGGGLHCASASLYFTFCHAC